MVFHKLLIKRLIDKVTIDSDRMIVGVQIELSAILSMKLV